MEQKNILGLDLGTNSVGWAVVNATQEEGVGYRIDGIKDAGCRIIPMDAERMGKFSKGDTVSQTCDRTMARGVRRLLERSHLRRERLHRVMSILGFLPEHYSVNLTRYGKFKDAVECKLAWIKDKNGSPKFLFEDSYNEMLRLFWETHPGLMKEGMKVPYDWTIYYLRKKALTEAITGTELAWILLNFNKKRGYYQTRGEIQDDNPTKEEKYLALKVVDVVNTNRKKGKDEWWFDVHLENGSVYHRTAKEAPNWVGMVKDFIVTTQLEKDGTPKLDKDGNVKQSIRMPSSEDWGLQKIKTQSDIELSATTVGAYIFNALLANPKQKIKGGLVRTIERDYYKDELCRILDSQLRFIPQLSDGDLYAECIKDLYQRNEAYRASIANRGFKYLFVDDIIFYHRPLKSKKSLIADCPYESLYIGKAGEKKVKYLKCISKSHPLYQEFRIWQFIANLKIYESKRLDGRLMDDVDVTEQFLPDEDSRVALFDYLNTQSGITQEKLLGVYFKKKASKKETLPYRWNYVQDKTYPCNETRGEILARLKKAGVSAAFLENDGAEVSLWHILYSVNDRTELKKALRTFAGRYDLDEIFVEVMSKFPPFESDYGAYSEKAIKKLLPLMRMGKYWSEDAIDVSTLERINNIINGEVDDSIRERVREKTMNFTNVEQFRGLPLWLACYVVYDRHSESKDTCKWTSPSDIDEYLKTFKQHSLHNPIVEQIVMETLRVVRDIWMKCGHIDEIHIELGREMKKTAAERKALSEAMVKNENTNLRVQALLTEFMNPEFEIENVRPYSPSQQEILRIYEECALNSVDDKDDEYEAIEEIVKKMSQLEAAKRPTRSEILRYKLWLDQRYVSPYTGQPIPLSRLFAPDYEIEHVIPKSLYFDDSMSNKVICEAEVNKLKDNTLAYEFIKNHHGEKVTLSNNRVVTILNQDSYCEHVEKCYKHNRAKMRKLLMEEIPTDFIERQLNDSRYISKLVKGLLSNIVREADEQEATSKNVIVCTGGVTDRLKREWGVNDVWNRLILPRFKRMNELHNCGSFTTLNTSGHLIPDIPIEHQKGFNKKRIDHRHHAMDAIVIACTTREHVNLLSNEASLPTNNLNRRQLMRKLCKYEQVSETRNGVQREKNELRFLKPWDTFTPDVEKALRGIIVSFKQNLRIVTKASNYSQRYVDGKKRMVKQDKGNGWAIRRPLHKDTVYGEVNLQMMKTASLKVAMARPERIVDAELKKEIRSLIQQGLNDKQIKAYFRENADVWSDVNLNKIEVYYFTKETKDRYFASRKCVDASFTEKVIKDSVTDTGIQKIMLRHLAKYNGDASVAFSPDGIEDMNRNIRELNDGHDHQPILKVRVYEKGEKFAVGQICNKNKKFVEAAKGTNLFFAVYENEVVNEETGDTELKRNYRTIPLSEVIVKETEGLPIDADAAFILSPNDLVYVPTPEEISAGSVKKPIDNNRIYKMVSATGNQCFFINECVASPIVNKNEFSALNKMQRAISGEMIKDICVPLKVDRLGNVVKIGK